MLGIPGIPVGSPVRILDDCRDGSPATGQVGVYEGRFEYKDVTSVTPPEPEPENGFGLRLNPRIRLSDGSCIWGVECWWIKESLWTERSEEE